MSAKNQPQIYRRAVVYALEKILFDEKYHSNKVLDAIFSGKDESSKKHGFWEMTKSDKSRCAAIFYGVLERRITLEFIIGRFISERYTVNSLKKKTLIVLLTGVYQLLYMDEPTHAIVDESVKLVNIYSKGAANGFVNAVLRNISRMYSKFLPSKIKTFELITKVFGNFDPSAKLDSADKFVLELLGNAIENEEINITKGEYLGILYSAPGWLVRLFRNYFGEERTERIFKSALETPPVFIRRNFKKHEDDLVNQLKKEGVSCEKIDSVSGLSNCYRVFNLFSPENSEAYKNGLFYIQDLSSQILCKLLSINSNEPVSVIDFCAAPGGKSFTLAQMIGNNGGVLAFDASEKRLEVMKKGIYRLGLENTIQTMVFDCTKNRFPEDLVPVDIVLCDVPCSCLGHMRRHPEIKYRDYDRLENLSPLQLNILENASRYVRPGGTLVYSTCTMNPIENEDVTEEFARRHPEFEPKTFALDIKDSEGYEIPDEEFMSRRRIKSEYLLSPDLYEGDGFFLSFFRRKK